MATVGGLTSQQIGDALGVPAGTVRYRLHRARTALATALDTDGHQRDTP
jgi:RNA polymerase sigma-70 factor (ECF subfamily)